jgi:hypothetical protein
VEIEPIEINMSMKGVQELDRTFAHKKFWVQAAGIFFVLGTITLVWLVVSVIIAL